MPIPDVSVPGVSWGGRDTSALTHEQIYRWVHEGADVGALDDARLRHAAHGDELRTAARRLENAHAELTASWRGRDADAATAHIRTLTARMSSLGDAVSAQAGSLADVRDALTRVQAAVGPPRPPALSTLGVGPAGLPRGPVPEVPDGLSSWAAFHAAQDDEQAARAAYRVYLEETSAAARTAPSALRGAVGPSGGVVPDGDGATGAPVRSVPGGRGGVLVRAAGATASGEGAEVGSVVGTVAPGPADAAVSGGRPPIAGPPAGSPRVAMPASTTPSGTRPSGVPAQGAQASGAQASGAQASPVQPAAAQGMGAQPLGVPSSGVQGTGAQASGLSASSAPDASGVGWSSALRDAAVTGIDVPLVAGQGAWSAGAPGPAAGPDPTGKRPGVVRRLVGRLAGGPTPAGGSASRGDARGADRAGRPGVAPASDDIPADRVDAARAAASFAQAGPPSTISGPPSTHAGGPPTPSDAVPGALLPPVLGAPVVPEARRARHPEYLVDHLVDPLAVPDATADREQGVRRGRALDGDDGGDRRRPVAPPVLGEGGGNP